MPTITINGRELTVPDGTTVMQAAHAHGIDIPHFCYHDGLSVAGNCRICLVEVEKFPKPAIACNTVVSDGMVVRTESETILEARKGVMEFLLANHPLDCPICDQAGECTLQEYSYRHGKSTARFEEEKEHGPKRRELGPHVLYDWERCIKCTRCIRFCEELPGTGELGLFLRGVRSEIGTFPGHPLDNPYSGNVVDICPVGALTLKEFRFRSRVWFLTDVPSVCGGCARGCSVNLGVLRNEIYRITPRVNHAVNRWWICDEGRLWARRMRAKVEERLSLAHAGAGKAPGWAAAIESAAGLLSSAARGGRVRVLASPRATLEEFFLLAKLAAGPLEGAPVHLAAHETGEDDDLLIRRDKSANRRGAELVLSALCGGAREPRELEAALLGGEVELLLALGPGLAGPVGDEPSVLSSEALVKVGATIVIDAYTSPLAEAAGVLLPAAAWGESAGSVVNFAGRVQHLARAVLPQSSARPVTMILADLFQAMTAEKAPTSAALAEALRAEIPEFAEIDFATLPASSGQDMAGCDAASQAVRATGAAAKMLASGWKL